MPSSLDSLLNFRIHQSPTSRDTVSRSCYASDTAIGNYEEARKRWELVGGIPAVLALLDEKLGETFFKAGRYDEAIPVLERAVECHRGIRDLEEAGRAASWLGHALSRSGRSQEGLERVQSLVELLSWSGPSGSLALLHLALGTILASLGR